MSRKLNFLDSQHSYINLIKKTYEQQTLMRKPSVIFVQGQPGTGKTELLHNLQNQWQIDASKPYVAMGNFTAIATHIPYSAIISALRNLLKEILNEDVANLQHWKHKLLAVLGAKANILCAFFPELEQIIDANNVGEFLTDNCSENVFNQLFMSFLGALTTTERPLVIMLDDLQWIDSGSVNLLSFLLANNYIQSFILILSSQNDILDFNSIAIHTEKINLNTAVAASVIATIEHTINQLSTAAKELVKMFYCYGTAIHTSEYLEIIQALNIDHQVLNKLIDNNLIKEVDDYLTFSNDSVHQAVQNIFNAADLSHFHKVIGDYYLSENSSDWLTLFYGVSHLSKSRALIKKQQDKAGFIEYCLLAGIKAKEVAANKIAMHYFKVGIGLIDKYTWKEYYQVCFELYKNSGICASLIGAVDESEKMLNIALSYAETDLEKVEIYLIQIMHYTLLSQHDRGQMVATQALVCCGIDFPSAEDAIINAINLEQHKIDLYLKDKEIKDLLHSPEMIDELKCISMQVLFRRATLCYLSGNVDMFMLCILTGINISFQYGRVDLAASMYAWYGMVLCTQQKYAIAYEFGQLAINISNEYQYCREKAQIYNVVSIFIINFRKHIRESINLLYQGYKIGLEVGDIQATVYTFGNIMVEMFAKGDNLASCLAQAEQAQQLAIKYKVFSAADIAAMYILAIKSLMQPDIISSFSESYFDQSLWQRITSSNSLPFLLLLKLQHKFWTEDYSYALQIAYKVKLNLQMIANYIISTDYYFYYALILLKQTNIDNGTVLACMDKLKLWAENCPANFLHKYILVKAEYARISNEVEIAFELYDEAIESAKLQGFFHVAALANELAGRFAMNIKDVSLANLYLQQAYTIYQQWGIVIKARKLKADFEIKEGINFNYYEKNAELERQSNTPIEQEMRHLASTVQAKRVVLLDINDNSAVVVSELGVDGNFSMLYASLDNLGVDFAQVVTTYLEQMHKIVPIDEAIKEKLSLLTSCIQRKNDEIVLCVPIKLAGKLKGLLYLEVQQQPEANYYHDSVLDDLALAVFSAWLEYKTALTLSWPKVELRQETEVNLASKLLQQHASDSFINEELVKKLGRRIIKK